MKILVAYASKMGGTQGLAQMLGNDLQELGHEVDVKPARGVKTVAPYDAVIVGGCLYMFRWHRDARRLVRRFRTELRRRPVWLFSSGPLDGSAATGDIPPVRSVRKAMARLGARGHVTFGGRMLEARRGLPAGDWRDPAQVLDWAKRISDELAVGEP